MEAALFTVSPACDILAILEDREKLWLPCELVTAGVSLVLFSMVG